MIVADASVTFDFENELPTTRIEQIQGDGRRGQERLDGRGLNDIKFVQLVDLGGQDEVDDQAVEGTDD